MKRITLLLIGFYFLCTYVLAQNITIVTEDYPPYNYLDNNKITGMSAEVVLAVLKETNVTYTHDIYPWARAYQMAKRDSNTLIHSIGRTAKRENVFQWIGVIAPTQFCLISLKKREDIQINSLDDLKQYKIGTIRDDIQEKHLLNIGFTKDKQIISVSRQKQNFDLLLKSRIDLWASVELTASHIARQNKHIPDEILKTKFCFKDLSTEGVYMAFSKNTTPSLINEFKKALIKIKENGIYDSILRKYL